MLNREIKISITLEQQPQECYPPIYYFKYREERIKGIKEGYLRSKKEIFEYLKINSNYIDEQSKLNINKYLKDKEGYINEISRVTYNPVLFGNDYKNDNKDQAPSQVYKPG